MNPSKKGIPTLTISSFSKPNPNFFFAEETVNNIALRVPYRSNYFFISLCTLGEAEINANLISYKIKQGSLITLSPQVVKHWVSRTDDYSKLTILFTKEFLLNNVNPNFLDDFSFFDLQDIPVTPLDDTNSAVFFSTLKNIQVKANSEHPYKNDVVRHLLHALLFEILAVYKTQFLPVNHKQTRGELLSVEFKKLVNLHFTKERSVKFYAELLFVTPKHLTETFKATTGKSAGEWIDENIVLEAKILLQDPSVNIAQIANLLNFTDQSTFGKFFKNLTNLSPVAYRQSLA